MSRKRKAYQSLDQTVNVVQDYKPKETGIVSLAEFCDAPIPDFSSPLEAWSFFVLVMRGESLANYAIVNVVDKVDKWLPRLHPILSSIRAKEREYMELLVTRFEEMRKPYSSGTLSGSSIAIVVAVLVFKLRYLGILIEQLQRYYTKSRGHGGFTHPFMPMSRPLSHKNGNVLPPPKLSGAPKLMFPQLYTRGVLMYPHDPVGVWSQFQIYQQILHLAIVWQMMNITNPELYKLLLVLFTRLSEFECSTFGQDDYELDMDNNYCSVVALGGLDERALLSTRKIVFSGQVPRVEKHDVIKDVDRDTRTYRLKYCTSNQFKAEVLGMLVPMIRDMWFYRRQIRSKTETPMAASRALMMQYLSACVVRKYGGASLMENEEAGPDNVAIPDVYGSEDNIDHCSSEATYNCFYQVFAGYMMEQLASSIDNTTRSSIAKAVRWAHQPYGLQERYSYKMQLQWSTEHEELENNCMPRDLLNYRIIKWSQIPNGEFMSQHRSLTTNTIFLTKLLNAACQHEEHGSDWSRDALLCTHGFTSTELTRLVGSRTRPFILQMCGSVFVCHNRCYMTMANLYEAIMGWFIIMYGLYGALHVDHIGRKRTLFYVNNMMNRWIDALPSDTVSMFVDHVRYALDPGSPGSELCLDQTSDASSEDSDSERCIFIEHLGI